MKGEEEVTEKEKVEKTDRKGGRVKGERRGRKTEEEEKKT